MQVYTYFLVAFVDIKQYSILFHLTSGSLPSGSIVDAPQTTPRQQRGWSAEGSVKKSMEHQAEDTI